MLDVFSLHQFLDSEIHIFILPHSIFLNNSRNYKIKHNHISLYIPARAHRKWNWEMFCAKREGLHSIYLTTSNNILSETILFLFFFFFYTLFHTHLLCRCTTFQQSDSFVLLLNSAFSFSLCFFTPRQGIENDEC